MVASFRWGPSAPSTQACAATGRVARVGRTDPRPRPFRYDACHERAQPHVARSRVPVPPLPYRDVTCGDLRATDAGRSVHIAGWVHRRRDHGHLIFLDLRDRYGITQVVVDAQESPDAHAVASRVRNEFVLEISGQVARRMAGKENADLETGEIEVRAGSVQILSEALTPPFYVNEPDATTDESLRLKYRYLDIRRRPLLDRLLLRSALVAGDPRRPPPGRLRGDRDADPAEVHARRSPRLHRPEPPPAGQRLRPAAEPAAAQAAADGRGDGPLLPDRALLPRRGSARRPPAGVHPARPGDELRGRAAGHGLR